MTEAPAATPGPIIENQLDEEFWGHCAQERLCFQRCDACGTFRHMPRIMCAACGSPDWSWQESCGRGHVYTWTITHQTPLPAFVPLLPFAVVVVEMAEGVRFVANTEGIANEDVRIGLPVEVVFRRISDTQAIPLFRHAGTAAE